MNLPAFIKKKGYIASFRRQSPSGAYSPITGTAAMGEKLYSATIAVISDKKDDQDGVISRRITAYGIGDDFAIGDESTFGTQRLRLTALEIVPMAIPPVYRLEFST